VVYERVKPTKPFTDKGIYLHGARSEFEPESPMHIRTWTSNAGYIYFPFVALQVTLFVFIPTHIAHKLWKQESCITGIIVTTERLLMNVSTAP